jgi:hypothetical protein
MLVSGISTTSGAASQLAIAIDERGGELLMINHDGSYFPIVDLPLLKFSSISSSPSSFPTSSISTLA